LLRSLDDIMQLQRQQQQQLPQQLHGSPAKLAWGSSAPSGKLLPSIDSNAQVS
jgi:hypothetical protein